MLTVLIIGFVEGLSELGGKAAALICHSLTRVSYELPLIGPAKTLDDSINWKIELGERADKLINSHWPGFFEHVGVRYNLGFNGFGHNTMHTTFVLTDAGANVLQLGLWERDSTTGQKIVEVVGANVAMGWSGASVEVANVVEDGGAEHNMHIGALGLADGYGVEHVAAGVFKIVRCKVQGGVKTLFRIRED